jgi:hypothetical protein
VLQIIIMLVRRKTCHADSFLPFLPNFTSFSTVLANIVFAMTKSQFWQQLQEKFID